LSGVVIYTTALSGLTSTPSYLTSGSVICVWKSLNECHPNNVLNCFSGYCSLMLVNTRSHPLVWQMYLRAEHKSFFTLGS
jgi:hypothetical protein